MWYNITEEEFRARLRMMCHMEGLKRKKFDFVTGPGRSGAVAAVYTSHHLGIPYIPHKSGNYGNYKRCLIIDTAVYTGKTLKKSSNWHRKQGLSVLSLALFKEEKKHYYKFWYENTAKSGNMY